MCWPIYISYRIETLRLGFTRSLCPLWLAHRLEQKRGPAKASEQVILSPDFKLTDPDPDRKCLFWLHTAIYFWAAWKTCKNDVLQNSAHKVNKHLRMQGTMQISPIRNDSKKFQTFQRRYRPYAGWLRRSVRQPWEFSHIVWACPWPDLCEAVKADMIQPVFTLLWQLYPAAIPQLFAAIWQLSGSYPLD